MCKRWSARTELRNNESAASQDFFDEWRMAFWVHDIDARTQYGNGAPTGWPSGYRALMTCRVNTLS